MATPIANYPPEGSMGCNVSTAKNPQPVADYDLHPTPAAQTPQRPARDAGPSQRVSHHLFSALKRAPSQTSFHEGDKYHLLGMEQSKVTEDDMAVGTPAQTPYLSKRDRVRHEVIVSKGRLYQRDQQGDPKAMHTRDALFVMDGKGKVYAGEENVVRHHSAFLAGNPAAAAGRLTVRNGDLKRVTDESGHYLPSKAHTQQFLNEMEDQGVDTTAVEKKLFGTSLESAVQTASSVARWYPGQGLRKKEY